MSEVADLKGFEGCVPLEREAWRTSEELEFPGDKHSLCIDSKGGPEAEVRGNWGELFCRGM